MLTLAERIGRIQERLEEWKARGERHEYTGGGTEVALIFEEHPQMARALLAALHEINSLTKALPEIVFNESVVSAIERELGLEEK